MLHTYVEEKRARVRQMWLRTGSDRSRSTLTVREVLSEASTAADGVLSYERSGFYRCRYAILGCSQIPVEYWRQGPAGAVYVSIEALAARTTGGVSTRQHWTHQTSRQIVNITCSKSILGPATTTRRCNEFCLDKEKWFP